MKSVRRIIFWLHLAAGVAAGTVILIMAVTGLLLAWERQLTEAADVPVVRAPDQPQKRLTVEELIPKAAQLKPGAVLTELTLSRNDQSPVRASFGRSTLLYLDPWSGAPLDALSPGTREFFRTVTAIHRWLGTSESRRDTGKALTGASNLVFLFLILSGIYLWWPRVMKWSAFRPVLWFRRNLSGKGRDWNWHHVLGFWSAIPLSLIVISGAVISYPWASALVFRIAGESPPASSGPPKDNTPPVRQPATTQVDLAGLNAAAGAAERVSSGWQTITLRLPAPANGAVFVVADAPRGRPDLQTTVTIDRATAAVVKRDEFAAQSPGRQARTWLRWIHTGEAGGFWGQTLGAIACACAAILVWTGFALAWRRLAGKKKAAASSHPEPLSAEQ